MEITITMDKQGRFSINVSEGVPIFVAIGALEVAKNMLINGDVSPTTEPQSEIIPDEVQ